MSALTVAQFEQDAQDFGMNAMDTSPISSVVDSAFLSLQQESSLQAQLLPPSHLYIDKSDPTSAALDSMNVSLPELVSPTFISPLDALDPTAPSSHTESAPFVPDFSPSFSMGQHPENAMALELSPQDHDLSASPPQSSMGHASNSSYSLGMTSSLESALDPTGVSTGRTRANTSSSPPVNSLSFSQIPIALQQSLRLAFTGADANQVEPTASLPASESQLFLVPLLKQ
jgi:hypothetical protein